MQESVDVAYVFLPLPWSAVFPHAWRCIFTANAPERFEEAEHEVDFFNVALLEKLTASIVMHQVEEDSEIPGLSASLAALHQAWGWSDATNAQIPPPLFTRKRTVAEVMVPLHTDDESEIGRAVTHAVSCCDAVLRAYYLATQRAAASVSLAGLPPLVPVAVRKVVRGETKPAWPKPSDLQLIPNPQSESIAAQPPALTDLQVSLLSKATSAPNDGPFGALVEVRRQMFASAAAANVTKAVLCGIAAELTLRELLALLLWEEGRLPSEAAALLGNVKVSNLARAQLPVRLGGNWTPILGDWQHHVAELRNRVVHIGVRPSDSEIAKAYAVHEDLGRFVGDRLAARLESYPLSAQVYLGDKGLDRRRVKSRLARRLADDQIPTDLQTHFSRWRREVQRCRDRGPWVGVAEGAVPMLVFYLNGTEQWWLMDESTELCCLGRPPIGLTDEMRTSIDRLRDSWLTGPERSEHVSVRVTGRSTPLEAQPEWVPFADSLPLNEYGRYPSCLVPPHPATGAVAP